MNENEFNTLVICSFRYALGRMYYVVGEVCQIIRKHYTLLTPQTKELIIKEINGARSLGRDCDEREWLTLKEFLMESR